MIREELTDDTVFENKLQTIEPTTTVKFIISHQRIKANHLFKSVLSRMRPSLRYLLAAGAFLMVASGPVAAQVKTTITFSTTWKFKTDPTNTGATSGWYSGTFNDSSWGTLLSNKSWQSQGQNYAGYAWYRQTIAVPAISTNVPLQPLQLNLGTINIDDEVWFNGTRVGGLTGGYKYRNLTSRSYMVPASLVNFGGTNSVAIRVWGGPSGSEGSSSGLASGTIQAVLDPFQVSARPNGGTIGDEKPLQLFDLSTAQKGQTFELVFRFPGSSIPVGGANLTYTLTDFYNASIKTGTVPVSIGADNIARGVVSVDAASATAIYLGGRFKATLTLKDAVSSATISTTTPSMDYLRFEQRDTTQLATLPTTYESTPYGSLKLVDTIDCATPLSTEEHPYMQSSFGNHSQDYMTPGVKISVPVNTILGKPAREPGYGWFAYRIGRGAITPGKIYLLRMEYPEDKPRFCEVEIQAGQNYMDVGWKNGLSSTDPYDPWPLSNAWQYYDVIVPNSGITAGTGGMGDDLAQNGIWIYVMRKVNYTSGVNAYFSLYSGGPAIATMKLYEIDPVANAPAITLPPAGIPQRSIMFDWERQAEQVPQDLVNYARLMGYSAISPNILKWGFQNYGDPVDGYNSTNIDDGGYWFENKANPAQPALPGVPSVHQQYLAATLNSGVDYIPRIEYGGSNNLPVTARPINNLGVETPRSRNPPGFCANLLDTATYADLKAYLDVLVKPNAAANPQLKGVLWRIRDQRLPISYGDADCRLFSTDTGTPLPDGFDSMTAAQKANWASVTVAAPYADWWHGKRRDFHEQVAALLKTYRSDMTFTWYNWDPDKFSIMAPDMYAADFVKSTANYTADRVARAGYTDAQYISVMNSGDFAANKGAFLNRPDFGLRPSLYSAPSSAGIRLLAPAHFYCFANLPNYLNYFQTQDGLAFSNCMSYEEQNSRQPNPKYECNMVTPAGAPFSMALELLAYYHGDAHMLTYTCYTYGRGFADAHRRFAQAFRALPALPGTVVTGMPTDVMVRTYTTANGTYVGVAYKGFTPSTFTVRVPGAAGSSVTNLVTGATVSASSSGSDLTFSLTSGPMELNAFLVTAVGLPAPWQQQDIGVVGLTGSASYASGTFSITGAGAAAGGSSAGESIRYVYQPVSGTDWTITSRVASQQNPPTTALSGVMIRQDLTPTAANATMLMISSGARFKYRVAPGGSMGNISSGGAIPYWVRVVRSGNTFTGYTSSNGVTWTQRGTATVTMSGTTYVGLVQCSGSKTTLSSATLDNVTVTSP